MGADSCMQCCKEGHTSDSFHGLLRRQMGQQMMIHGMSLQKVGGDRSAEKGCWKSPGGQCGEAPE